MEKCKKAFKLILMDSTRQICAGDGSNAVDNQGRKINIGI